ncbi:Mpv17/PMP22 family protein [Colletotrichum scovillei]|uniref:Mpv17/PMP22 family protein n=1 Tax=Colletotrichum scovillei TaxID=1209932 RepID=UPI0015C3C371|nr:Mpv17/PMP22 family protein [Colletotrichum scovillei]KAF4780439.1 Mpv17/PMP22 family protein [Colletotrichum scovillei]
MALPPIVTATLQSAALSGTSNILAQVLTAYQTDKQLVIDWVPVFQFIIFTLLSTPPNFLWWVSQRALVFHHRGSLFYLHARYASYPRPSSLTHPRQGFLEESFPAYHVSPTKKAIASAAANDDKALDREAREDQLVEPKLNIRNTLIKLVLDQTVGAALNTLAFSMFMHSIQTAMVRPEHLAAAQHSGTFLFSRGAIDYSNVDWQSVVHKSQLEFVPIFIAGLKLWPMVSLVNFAFIKSIEGRNLVGSLAGVAWGIYMSLVAAR